MQRLPCRSVSATGLSARLCSSAPPAEDLLSTEFTMPIDGQAVPGHSFFDVRNPFNGQVIARCPEASKQQMEDAVAAAARAFPSWSQTPVERRRELLLKATEVVQGRLEEIARVLTLEQGKPLKDARMEVMGVMLWGKTTASLDLPATEVLKESSKTMVKVEYRPLGVCLGITPWNFPLSLAQWKIAPALLAGNTFVLKPSPYTPLSSLLLGEVYNKVLPPGVVNVVTGGNQVGAWLTQHPKVAKITFTGSVPTGKLIQKECAADLKRCTLELGGNDAAIVLPDADISKVAGGIFAGAFANNGQVCSAIKRVYVSEGQHDDLVAALTKIASSVKVGNGLDESTQLGPVQNEMQVNKVAALVEDARKRGATINCGGTRLSDSGYCFAPTIISNVDESFDIVSEEQFGPVLPVLRYTTVEEAVARANDSNFGLSGSVWGTDEQLAAQVAHQLDVGTAWVNQHLRMSPLYPFGGSKWSGIGRENGKWGLNAFLETRCINVAKL